MGCFWSSEDVERCKCIECNRRGVNNLRIIDHRCESTDQASRRALPGQYSGKFLAKKGYCYGEYKCSCGYSWSSRRSWAGYSQNCKICRREVYAHTQRELRPSDKVEGKANGEKHIRELCQKCRQLGHDCGKPARRNPAPGKKRSGTRSKGMATFPIYRMSSRKWKRY